MKTRDLVLVAIFVSLSVISAFLKIPLPGLPLTFQLATAIASGIFLGKVLGPASQGIYLVLGLIGLPVFAKGGGQCMYCNHLLATFWHSRSPRSLQGGYGTSRAGRR